MILVCLLSLCCAFGLMAQTSKPVLKVGKDGLPSGHPTPEGTACDLARAFIQHNVPLFKSTCIKPFGGGAGQKQYVAFLKQTAQSMTADAKKATPSPAGPKAIGIVFAARHLSQNGPASYGYAVLGFKEVEFVDVGVFLQSGKRAMNRTLVIQTSDGKWYVYPLPSADPLLSSGLNQESNSTKEIGEVYTLKPE
ncbi:MAG: hypothetical protein JWL77_6071 [Chthonomonadaceae bacterium]|nr:hypothetical protein [Chthonomonadaceae bacterium]